MACRISPRLPWLLFICAVAIGLSADVSVRAQNFDASRLTKPANLDARWLIYAGDDPAFARPDFDDSRWTLFDPNSPLNEVFPSSKPEIVWYRLRVKVNPALAGVALSETMISRAFEIYVNGERLMALGHVQPYVPYTMFARIVARIPDRMLDSGTIVIAQRVRISPNEWTVGQNPGYFVTNLSIGQEETLYRDGWLTIIGQNGLDWLDRLLRIGLGFVALVLFAAQRRQTVYLWIFAIGAITLAESVVPVTTTFYNIPVLWELVNSIPRLVSPYIWASLYFSFVHQRVGWRWRTFLIAAGVLNFIAGLQGWFLAIPLPLQLLTNLPFVILLSVFIPVVLIIHWRRGNREAGILLIPVILFSLYIYADVGLQALFQFPAWTRFRPPLVEPDQQLPGWPILRIAR